MGESNKGDTYVKIAKHRNGSLENIKLKALLHIQKFVEEEGAQDFMNNPTPGGGGNRRPVSEAGGGDAKMFIQKGSKMNDEEYDDDERPF
jgi:replicative DNA helicase